MTISGDVIRVDEGMFMIEGEDACWSISVDYFRRLNDRDPEVGESVVLEFEVTGD